jgi:nicotinamide-nucleotide amidase
MKAEIISIGTELLLGEITNTNASYLAGQLPPLGIDLYWITEVGDNKARIVEALKRAWSRSDLILTIGGLGPTDDDLTREAIAEFLGEEIRIDPGLEQWLRGKFREFGLHMPECNLKQVTLISSARAIFNPLGTAPGWWVEKEGKALIAMPGPPRELEVMWEQKVRPELQEKFTEGTILSRTLKTWGHSEAKINELVSLLLSSSNPTLAIYAKPEGIQLRITAKAVTRDVAQAMVTEMEQKLRSIIGDAIWGVDAETLPEIVISLLRGKKLSLAVQESYTGGLLCSTITEVPESSRYFKGGLVAYPEHAIGSEAAEAMAEKTRSYFGADIGLGIAGLLTGEKGSLTTVYTSVVMQERKQNSHGIYPHVYAGPRIISGALFELRRFLLGLY